MTLWEAFQTKYGDTYETVSDYYAARQNDVALRDAAPLLPQLLPIVDAAPLTDGETED